MNREILFRGKSLSNGEWVYGFYTQGSFIDPNTGKETVRHIIDNGLLHDIAPDTVGQFTGLVDKNEAKIFERDIIRIYDSDYEEYSDHQVKFAHGVFGIDNWTGKLLTTLSFFMCGNDSEYSVEVIGNIYNNPELLSIK